MLINSISKIFDGIFHEIFTPLGQGNIIHIINAFIATAFQIYQIYQLQMVGNRKNQFSLKTDFYQTIN